MGCGLECEGGRGAYRGADGDLDELALADAPLGLGEAVAGGEERLGVLDAVADVLLDVAEHILPPLELLIVLLAAFGADVTRGEDDDDQEGFYMLHGDAC